MLNGTAPRPGRRWSRSHEHGSSFPATTITSTVPPSGALERRIPADRRPVHRRGLGDGRARRPAPMPSRGRRRRPGLRVGPLAGADAVRARPAAVEARRPGRRAMPSAWRRSSSATTASWSTEVRGPGPLHGRLLPLLRRARRQGPERGHPDRQEGRVRLHQVRGERRRRDHHAVELAAHADQLEAGAGAGGGLHDGRQAVGVHVGVDARVREAVRGGRLPAGRRQRRHRASARRSARRWSRTRRSRTSASPAAPRRGARSTSWRRAASRRSRWSSAASRRTSCSTTPTSTRRSRAWCPASSRRPARAARRARGCCCRNPSTTASSRS